MSESSGPEDRPQVDHSLAVNEVFFSRNGLMCRYLNQLKPFHEQNTCYQAQHGSQVSYT